MTRDAASTTPTGRLPPRASPPTGARRPHTRTRSRRRDVRRRRPHGQGAPGTEDQRHRPLQLPDRRPGAESLRRPGHRRPDQPGQQDTQRLRLRHRERVQPHRRARQHQPVPRLPGPARPDRHRRGRGSTGHRRPGRAHGRGRQHRQVQLPRHRPVSDHRRPEHPLRVHAAVVAVERTPPGWSDSTRPPRSSSPRSRRASPLAPRSADPPPAREPGPSRPAGNRTCGRVSIGAARR